MLPDRSTPADLRVVLFSGGRGSGALVELLATDSRIRLTVAINGYDDGASTGEVRRFLGDSLGPSDFRKNASRLARLRGTCSTAVIEFLDQRLPDAATADDVRGLTAWARTAGKGDGADNATWAAVADRLLQFDDA